MVIKAILTNRKKVLHKTLTAKIRELKNKVTGLDLYVSDYQEIPHRIKNSYLYHVIVVTNLFYYKLKGHRESDVVQFMISKPFEEFQDLYEKLYKRFPSVNFPSLPSKLTLSATNLTKARLEVMNQVLTLVAKTQKLACSPMVISFLRGDPSQSQQPKNEEAEIEDDDIQATESSNTFNEPDQDDVDLFVNSGTDENKDDMFSEDKVDSGHNKPSSNGHSIFDDEAAADVEQDLFSKSNPVKQQSEYEKTYDVDDDEDDLLNVADDDFNDLLKLSKSSEKQSSIKVQRSMSRGRTSSNANRSSLVDDADDSNDMFKQARTQSVSKKSRNDSSTISDIFEKKTASLFDTNDDDDLFTSGTKKSEEEVASMGQDDITSYILQQETSASDEVSLGI